MKDELKDIKKNLKATLNGFKDAEKEYGYDLGNETYYVKQALKQVNLLLLPVRKSRCCGRCDGVDDLCVADMVCDEHEEKGCEICYGSRDGGDEAQRKAALRSSRYTKFNY
jgi:hypothetical protein